MGAETHTAATEEVGAQAPAITYQVGVHDAVVAESVARHSHHRSVRQHRQADLNPARPAGVATALKHQEDSFILSMIVDPYRPRPQPRAGARATLTGWSGQAPKSRDNEIDGQQHSKD